MSQFAVCGKCSVPIELHPVEHCPYLYHPVEGYGWSMSKKEEKNGQTKKEETAQAG